MSDDWVLEPTEERMARPLVASRTEPELLAAIERQDHAARLVYADWLEEQGDHARAEYVRLQDATDSLAHQRIRQLNSELDAAWRVIVARPAILGCKRDDCPGDWGALAPTGRSDLRTCTRCDLELRYHTSRPHQPVIAPLVLDGHYERGWPEDLDTAELRPVRAP